MALITIIKQVLAILTSIGVLSILATLLFIPFRKRKNIATINNFFVRHALGIALIIALIATTGSLFFSEYAGYEPCKLCWFQRILMYPLVIILSVSIIKKLNPTPYVLPLSILGAPLALYHYSLQIREKFFMVAAEACSATGPSCSATHINFTLGYVTIPLMSAVAFTLIIILLRLKKK